MKNKINILLIAGIFLIVNMSFVFAVETAAFDLYYLFVENVFGNLMLAGLGIAALFMLMGMVSKMSSILLTFLLAIFLATFAVGSVGALAAIPIFILSFGYFFMALLSWWTER